MTALDATPPTALFDVAESKAPQALTLRCRPTRAVPAGAPVRLQPATWRTFLGGFMPERIALADLPPLPLPSGRGHDVVASVPKAISVADWSR